MEIARGLSPRGRLGAQPTVFDARPLAAEDKVLAIAEGAINEDLYSNLGIRPPDHEAIADIQAYAMVEGPCSQQPLDKIRVRLSGDNLCKCFEGLLRTRLIVGGVVAGKSSRHAAG